jgi:hypothetical protein
MERRVVTDMLYNPGVVMEASLPISLLEPYPHELDELTKQRNAIDKE